MSADIDGMFLEVGVLPSDQPTFRFLWREDPTNNVAVYLYTRHFFVAKLLPYNTINTARDNAKYDHEAPKAVLENFYKLILTNSLTQWSLL